MGWCEASGQDAMSVCFKGSGPVVRHLRLWCLIYGCIQSADFNLSLTQDQWYYSRCQEAVDISLGIHSSAARKEELVGTVLFLSVSPL